MSSYSIFNHTFTTNLPPITRPPDLLLTSPLAFLRFFYGCHGKTLFLNSRKHESVPNRRWSGWLFLDMSGWSVQAFERANKIFFQVTSVGFATFLEFFIEISNQFVSTQENDDQIPSTDRKVKAAKFNLFINKKRLTITQLSKQLYAASYILQTYSWRAVNNFDC